MPLTPTAYWRGHVDTKLLELVDSAEEHGRRITALERFMWKLIGIAAIGSFAGAVLATITAYAIIHALAG